MKKLRKVIAIALSICLCSAMTLTSYADETYDEAPLADGVVGEEIATDSDATESDAIEDYGIATMSEAAIAPLYNSDYPDPYLSYYKNMDYYNTNLGSLETWAVSLNKKYEIDALDSDLADVITYFNVDRNQDGYLDFSELDYLTFLCWIYSGWDISILNNLIPTGGHSEPLSVNSFPIWAWIDYYNSKGKTMESCSLPIGACPLDISALLYTMNGSSYAESNFLSYDRNGDGLADTFKIPYGDIDADDDKLINNFKKMIDNQTYCYSLTSLNKYTLANGGMIINNIISVSVEMGESTGAAPDYNSTTKTITLHIPDGSTMQDYYDNYPVAYFASKKILLPCDSPISSGVLGLTVQSTQGYVICFKLIYDRGEYGGTANNGNSGITTHPIWVYFNADGMSNDPDKKITIVEATYNQTHKFVSGTTDKELPSAIVSRTPSKVKDLADGTTVTPGTFDTSDYKVDDGVWKWQSWDHESLTISGADVEFIGTWVFTPKTTPTTPSKPSSGGDDDDDDGGGGHTPTPTPNPNPTPNPTPNPSVTPDPVPPTEIPANPVPEKLTEKQWSDLVARTKDPNDPLFGMDPMQVALSNMYLNNGIPKTGEDPSHAWVYLLMSLSLMCAAYSVSKKKEA